MDQEIKQMALRRTLRELNGSRCVGLGPGLPSELKPHLESDVEAIDLTAEKTGKAIALAIVEAEEVSAQGDLALLAPTRFADLEAERWIVVTPLLGPDGAPRMVKQCRLPVAKAGCVELVVTDLGVIEVDTNVGFILKEIVPGASSDDVRMRVEASLHVADDLSLVEL